MEQYLSLSHCEGASRDIAERVARQWGVCLDSVDSRGYHYSAPGTWAGVTMSVDDLQRRMWGALHRQAHPGRRCDGCPEGDPTSEAAAVLGRAGRGASKRRGGTTATEVSEYMRGLAAQRRHPGRKPRIVR